MARVRIVKVPKALSGLEVKMNPGLYGTNGNSQFNKSAHLEAGKISQKPTEVRQSLTAVPREKANLEAEGGETAVVNVDGIPAHFKISGPRHTNGGVPLNLPDNSFIFSDTAKMKIKDPNILAQFGMKPKRGGYTPAEIAKKYDINKFRKVLADPNTDDLQRKTAEMMIANYNEKLAKLALAQESVKGFPQGIPVIAMPYIENMEMNPATFLPDQAQEQSEETEQPDAEMGTSRYGSQVINQFPTKAYGGVQYRDGLPMGQHGFDPTTLKGWGAGLLNVLEAPQRAMMYAGTGLFGDLNYEMVNPKTGQKEWVDEDIAKLRKRQGYTYTGETKKAFYEMPGESLKRNYPESSPYLQGAADIFADPLLVAGIAKTGARLATKKLIKETADAVVNQSMKGLTKEEMIHQIIKNAGKLNKAGQASQKNINIVSKALDAGADAFLKNQSKGAIKQAKAIEKAVTKAAGTARQVEDLKLTGKKVYEAAKEFKKVVPEISTEGVRLFKEHIAEPVSNFLAGPYAGPVTLPIVKNIPGIVNSAIYKEQVEEQKKQIENLKQQIAQGEKTKITKTQSTDKDRNPLYTHRDKPGQYFYMSKTKDNTRDSLVPYNPQMGLYGPVVKPEDSWKPQPKTEVPDTTGQAEYNKLMGIEEKPKKEFGGALTQYRHGGGGVNKSINDFPRVHYNDGSIYNTATKQWEKEEDEGWKIKKDKSAGTKETRMSVGFTNVGSTDEETGEYLPFDKSVAGKGKGDVALDIKPWYGDEMKTNYTPEEWAEFVKSTGFQPTVKNTAKNPKAQVQEFQYYLAHHPDWKSSIDELHGTTDKGFGKPTKSKKKYDGFLGRRWDKIVTKKPEAEKGKLPEQTPAPKITITPEEKKNTTVPPQVIKRNSPVPVKGGAYAPWWLQDIVKTSGAAADLARVNRYLPWQATPEVRLPDATFYDPTRELAANAEQANIQTQGLAAFTGPQALSARSSAIQGQAAKNAADIMARYNNMNVQLANQLNQERTSIMNTAAQQKAALDTQLFDKYTIANQQFDNSMNMARQNLRQSYIDAITNRAKTQALNTLYPNYYTDPSRGGMLTFAPDFSKIPAEQPDNTNDYYEALRITGDPDRALRYLELRNKGAINDPYGERNAYRRSMNYPEEQG